MKKLEKNNQIHKEGFNAGYAKAVKQIRKKVVELAISGQEIPDELKGVIFYTKLIMYLNKL